MPNWGGGFVTRGSSMLWTSTYSRLAREHTENCLLKKKLHFFVKTFGGYKKSAYLCTANQNNTL